MQTKSATSQVSIGASAWSWHALLFPCNLIGLGRIGLIGAATLWLLSPEALSPEQKLTVLALLLTSSLLDALDGPLARRLGQQTGFGRWLDQLTDLGGATVLWLASGLWIALPVLVLEWLAGVASLTTPGDSTRSDRIAHRGPMGAYFANGQRNALSIIANVSHVVFPAAVFLGPGFEAAAWLAVPGLVLFEVATAFILLSCVRANRQPAASRCEQ